LSKKWGPYGDDHWVGADWGRGRKKKKRKIEKKPQGHRKRDCQTDKRGKSRRRKV